MLRTDLSLAIRMPARWCIIGLFGAILLTAAGRSLSAQPQAAADSASPSVLGQIASAGGRAGWMALRSVATADYMAYGLEDLLPLEQVFLPEIPLPQERHPSLLFPREGVDILRLRTSREPYASWWLTVLQRAEASLTQDLSDPRLEESRRALAAKSCAFAFVITGQASFLHKARQALLHISPPPSVTTPEGGEKGQGWGDWIRASGLMLSYCAAYDLVAMDLSAEDRHLVAGKIAAEADQLYRNLKFAPPNNHKTLMAVAVGTAALTIPSYGSGVAQTWLDAALINLRSGLAQIERDGSYREGVFYAGYISRLLFPFALYLKHTTGYDLFGHRRIEDLIRWLIQIGLPDRSIPLIDDGWQENHVYLPILVGQSRLGGVARWIHERSPRRISEYLMEVDFICAFDDRVAAEPPPWDRTAFFPDGGMAVFGDGWSPDGVYLLLLGEGREALDTGHEHLDPGHFILQAHGQDLLIEAAAGPQGRISDGRSWYLSAEGHNMLLVDGQGPTGNPFSQDQPAGELVHCFRGAGLSSAAVKAHYRDTEIQRTVHFLGGCYFLIFDQLNSPQPHDYELVLHGLGSSQVTGPDKVVWSPAGGRLEAEFLCAEKDPLKLSLRTGQHTPQYDRWESHTYLRAGRNSRTETHFTTLLLPQSVQLTGLESVELPVLSPGPARAREISGESLRGAHHILLATDGQKATAGGVSTDALVSATGLAPDGHREFFFTGRGTFYEHLGDTCYIADEPITLSMFTGLNRWAGYVDAGQREISIRLETGFDPGQVRFADYPVEYQYQGGWVTVHLKSAGPLELGAGPPLIFTPQTSRERYPFLEQLARQDRPMARFEELRPEQRFLVQLQAFQVARTQVNEPVQRLSRSMGLGPDGFHKALGVFTGLADKAYDPHRWARLNLPEHLQGQKSVGWGELSYNQDGYLTEEGLKVERLEGRLSRPGWGSVEMGHYSPYPEVVNRTLSLQMGDLTLGAGWEKLQSSERRQYSALHRWRATVWGLEGYSLKGSENYGINLLLRGPSLTAEVSQHRGAGEPPGRRLFLAHRGGAFAPQAELLDPGPEGGKDLRVAWSAVPLRAAIWEFSTLLTDRRGRAQLRQFDNAVSWRSDIISGQLRGHYLKNLGSRGWADMRGQWGRSRWNLGTSFDQRHRPFVVEERLSLSRNWTRWLSCVLGISHRGHPAHQDDQVRLALSAHLAPEPITVIHMKLEETSHVNKRISWSLGVDRRGMVSWGGGWADEWDPGGIRRWHVSLHGSLQRPGGTVIQSRAEIDLTPDGRTEGYQIEIQQLGAACSPGLLFSKKPLTGVRNDGFIQFRF